MPRTRNRLSGEIDKDTPQHLVDHPVLGKFLEVVGPDDKPLVAALAPKGEKAAEIAASSKRSKTNDKDDN
jgi:hypothetical protein